MEETLKKLNLPSLDEFMQNYDGMKLRREEVVNLGN
jgi:hypothetical protein